MHERKRNGETQTGEITDERKNKIFIESAVDKFNVLQELFKIASPVAIHA